MRGHPPRRLLRRLFVGQLLVVVAGATTLGLVAFLVAPPIFRDHVRRAMGPVSDVVSGHLDLALTQTLWLALAIGITAAILTAAGVSWLLATRLARPVEDLSHAAVRLASGELAARTPAPSVDDELTDLTRTFNLMAQTLEDTDRTRRRLLSDLAHELRTPLATLEGYHEGLADGIVEADPATLEVLTQATARLRRLVEDVSLVSRAEEGQLDLERRPCDLHVIVTQAIESLRPTAANSDVTLALDLPDRDVMADVDRVRLGQVLDNLLGNALTHTPAGGTVTVTLRRVSGRAEIAVTDTGAGIAEEHLPHVFDRFYRADPARTQPGGSGIGLTISRALVAGHGGRLTAESLGAGQGATFTIRLPAADADR